MGNKECVPQDTTPDSTTGLSAKDRYWIQKSWAEISPPSEITDNGVEFFIQLFTKFPHMKNYFSKIKDVEVDKLKQSALFRAHAVGVMHYINSYVDCLDDGETLVELVKKLVESHIGRGITLKDFEDLKSMFIPYLYSLLGKKHVTPEIEEAWGKLLGAQNAIFEDRAKALGK